MKITHISTYDISGGAAKAAYRLHNILLQQGYDSNMLVMKKDSDEERIFEAKSGKFSKYIISKVRRFFEKTLFYKYKNRENKILFSYGKIGLNISDYNIVKESDIIHLHWFNDSYINIETLKKLKSLNKKIIITLHDMWLFTGGCHYSGQCRKYEKICEKCTILESNKKNDISNHIYKYKEKLYKEIDFDIITCSNWLNDCASNSKLLKDKNIVTIPNILDKKIFKNIEKNVAREVLGLEKDSVYICFGAVSSTSDPRKGFEYLLKALHEFKKYNKIKKIKLLVFGSSSCKDDLPLETIFMGKVYDDYTLSLIYNAADVFVAPSLEDNLPNTVLESLYCNTPVVSFNIGGMPDMIEHKFNGYLAEVKDYKGLAKGIDYIINEFEEKDSLVKPNLNEEKIINCLDNLYKTI